MTTEIWKDVIEYEGLYQVSNLGRVKSLSKLKKSRNKNGEFEFMTKEIILKQALDDGYKKVSLTKNKKRLTLRVHRIVATAFLGNQKNLCVNHIDFNRSNNNIENLEWVTVLQNNRHSRENNRFPKMIISLVHRKKLDEATCKKVICIETNKIYNSASEAALKLGFKKSTLIHYLVGSRKNKTTLRYI